MTTGDLITALFYEVDEQLRTIPKHPEAHLWPSEVVTVGLLHALKGVGNRPFYRWLTRDYRPLFPRLPERTRLFRLLKTHQDWTQLFMAAPTVLGEPIFVEARIAGSEGELEVPSEEIAVPIEGLEASGDKVAFRLITPYGIYRFEGTRAGEIVRGHTISPGGDRMTMHLRRMPAPPDLAPFVGTYRSSAGDEVMVIRRPKGQLRATGLTPLRSLRLVALEGDRFVEAAQ